MTSFTLEPFKHNAKSCIAIKFQYNFEVKEYIKRFNGLYWTKTHSTFYIYFDEVRLEDLKNYIKKGGFQILNDTQKNEIPRFSKGVKIEVLPLNQEKLQSIVIF